MSQSPLACEYLKSREIDLEIASLAGVRFQSNWAPSGDSKSYHGGPALLFPLCDETGELHAVGSRYIDPRANFEGKIVKARTGGRAKRGAFFAPALHRGGQRNPLERQNPHIFLVEGPCCALSLALCGVPALAVNGCTLSDFLPRLCGLRTVLIGADSDDGGEEASTKWTRTLTHLGAKCRRIRAEEAVPGAKDWNEVLRALGRAEARGWLQSQAVTLLHRETDDEAQTGALAERNDPLDDSAILDAGFALPQWDRDRGEDSETSGFDDDWW